jgi:hypothetical protein
VLSLCQGWAADRERDTAARLTAAEVELAALRVKNEEQSAALAGMAARGYAAHEALTRAGVGYPRDASLADRVGLLVAQRSEARAQIEGLRIGLEAAVERGRRWERHARALARTAHMAVGMMGPARLALARGWLADIRAREGRDDTRPEHDAPPPPTTRSPRAPAPPSPPRFRATAGGES